MSPESKRGRLPFEPHQNKKKKPKKAPTTVNTVAEKPKKVAKSEASLSAIPDAVSKRMARRMALFCGLPTAVGMSSFFIFYWVNTNNLLELPTYVALFVSIGFFGLGILGLSYGIFSASWDENQVGSWLGLEEFKINFGRTIAAWRNSRQTAKGD
jgi:hypothetical protein